MSRLDADQMDPSIVLFSRLEPGMLANPKPLKGTYRFTLTTMILSDDRAADDPYLVISGRVSGLLGTDNSKRDLWSGLVVGTKWALLIGLLTAFVAVGIGVVIAGIASAYYRGWVEVVMQRIFEIIRQHAAAAPADHHLGGVQAQHLVHHPRHVPLLLDRAP